MRSILLNFKLKNEASRANLNKNKRIFKFKVALAGECKFEILKDSETGNFSASLRLSLILDL